MAQDAMLIPPWTGSQRQPNRLTSERSAAHPQNTFFFPAAAENIIAATTMDETGGLIPAFPNKTRLIHRNAVLHG